MKNFVLAFTLALAPLPAFALSVPAPGVSDFRVRFVNYDPHDVTKITTHFGYSTNIVFAAGEHVLEKGIYLGDPEAWQVATLNNHLFVKPKMEGGRTNMTVLTNRRAYNFELSAHWSRASSAPKDMKFQVNFNYPKDAAIASTTQAQIFAAVQEEAEMKAKLLARPAPRNWAYSVQGSKTAAPNAAWDDGHFTYFRFDGAREMPAIFVVNDDGSESLINRNVEDGTIVVQALGRKFILRRGNQVACVFNDAFDAVGTDSDTGTTTPDVVREIKGRTQ